MSLTSILLITHPGIAYANPTCGSNLTYFEPQQITNDNDLTGMLGNITDPAASYLQGTSSDQDDEQHILLYLSLWDESTSGSDCFEGSNYCWNQLGAGMGLVEGSRCTATGANYTQLYQVYYEDYSPSNCTDNFYPAIAISQGGSITFNLYYDMSNGYTGYPQVQGYVKNSADNWVYVNEGELYSVPAHAAAITEVENGTTSVCPILTNGPPYQNFGTNPSGGWSGGAPALQLLAAGSYTNWGGTPEQAPGQPYYFDLLANSPADFQTNGPSTGPS